MRNPYIDGAFSELVVSEDKTRAILVYVRESSVLYAQKEKKLLLKGLDENQKYLVQETGEIFTGKALHYVGLEIVLERMDYSSTTLHLTKV